jgi:hypothetical protein
VLYLGILFIKGKMISLVDGKGAVEICSMVHGRKRLPVYYHDEFDQQKLNRVENFRDLVKSHMGELQSRHRVTLPHLEAAIGLHERQSEPEETEHPHVRKMYWTLRDLKRTLLSREMDIRGEKQRFEIGIPRVATEYFGHVAVLGPSGSGKGYWITGLILQHWKSASFLNRRRVYYVSAEATLDKTLKRLDVKKYEDWFIPIDVSYEAGLESGQSPEEFWAEHVDALLSNVRNAIIVLDDTQDGYSPKEALKTQDKLVRIGRHKNISVISVYHSIRNGMYTKQLLQSAWHVVIFGRAQRGRVRDFFHEVFGMPRREAQNLVDHMNQCGRAAVVRTLAPVTLICEKYMKLL